MKKLFQMFKGGVASSVNINVNSCSSGEKIQGSGRVIEKNISLVQTVEEITTDGVFNVKVEHTEKTQSKVVVSGDDNIVDYIVVKEESFGLLKLAIKENVSFVTNNEITVTVYTNASMIRKINHKGTGNLKMIGNYNHLKTIKQTGVGNLKIEAVVSDDCIINQDGVGSVSFTNISCGTCTIKQTGVGKLTLHSGSIAELYLKNDGVGSTDLSNVVINSATVKTSGVGNLTIAPKQKLDVTISGTGDVVCIGKPEFIHKKESGLGKLKYK